MALKDFKNQKGFIDLNNETSRTEVVQGIYNEVYQQIQLKIWIDQLESALKIKEVFQQLNL